MEPLARRRHVIQDRENVYGQNGKGVAAKPVKLGLAVRGALGDVNTNVEAQRNVTVGKVAVAAAEFEKKASRNNKSNYGHVQSKIDTGLACKNVKSTLRREESTASLATRAAARTKAALKDVQTKTKPNENASGSLLNVKKNAQETKRITKLQGTVRAQCKEKVSAVVKPTPREPTESLKNLKLTEKTIEYNLVIPSFVGLPDDPLPEDVIDIDAGDINNPLLMPIYIRDIYSYLTSLELQYKIEPDYLKNQAVVTARMRATLLDWLLQVHSQFNLILETFQLAVGIIDRYLQIVTNVQRNQLQLVGVTALYVASKYEEVYPPDVADFVFVTDNSYSKHEIFRCERDILTKLQFCLARPIPLTFLRRYIKAGRGSSKHHHLAKYFVDLCLVEYTMAHYRPSELASAAICLSLCLLSNKNIKETWTPTLAYHSTYTLKHIDPIVRKIAQVVVNFKPESTKLTAVYEKYLDPTLARVSSFPQLKGDAIYELSKMPTPDY